MEEEKEIEIVEDVTLEEKIKKIKGELKECQKEKEEYLLGWQRSKADFINYKKDEEKNREEFIKFSSKNILYDILKVVDSIDIALKHKENEGMREIKNQFLEVLKENVVEEINVNKGMKFDPTEHESIMEFEVETDDLDGVIIEELQKGYKLFNRVLRPSKVKVGIYKK